MARSHGRIYARIWKDPDFRALTGDQKLLYLALLSQPELTHAGTITTAYRRWARMTPGVTVEDVQASLTALDAARFIVIDWDTDEVLVRTLIRNDEVYRQPLVMRSAADSIRAVTSSRIRAALATELRRLPLDKIAEGKGARAEVTRLVDELLAELDETAGQDPSPRVRERVPETLGEGFPGGSPKGSHANARAAPSPTPTPTPAPSELPGTSPGGAPAELVVIEGGNQDPARQLTPGQRAKAITDVYATAEPMCRWPAVRGIVAKAISADRWSDVEIRDALLRLAADRRPVTVDTLRVELDGLPAARPRPSFLGQSLVNSLAAAERLRQEQPGETQQAETEPEQRPQSPVERLLAARPPMNPSRTA